MAYRFLPSALGLQPGRFPGILRTLAIGAQPRADEAAAGYRREIVDLREQAVLLQRLQHAQGKGGAAYAAAGDCEASEVRVVTGPCAAPEIDPFQFLPEYVGP